MNEHDDDLTIEDINEANLAMEAKGLVQRMRDVNGNVMTKPDSKGVPQILWGITDLGRAWLARENGEMH